MKSKVMLYDAVMRIMSFVAIFTTGMMAVAGFILNNSELSALPLMCSMICIAGLSSIAATIIVRPLLHKR